MGLPELRQALTNHLGIDDINTLAFDLGIDPDELRGQSITARARELIIYCRRRSMLPLLIEKCSREYPNVNWKAVLEQPTESASMSSEDGRAETDLDQDTDTNIVRDLPPGVAALHLIGIWELETVTGQLGRIIFGADNSFQEHGHNGFEIHGQWKLDTVNSVLVLLGSLNGLLAYCFVFRITAFKPEKFYARGEDGLTYRYTRIYDQVVEASAISTT